MLVEKVNFAVENINSNVKYYKITSVIRSSTFVVYLKFSDGI